MSQAKALLKLISEKVQSQQIRERAHGKGSQEQKLLPFTGSENISLQISRNLC